MHFPFKISVLFILSFSLQFQARELVLSVCECMFCQCVHAPGLLKSCHMLSSSSFPKSVTPLSFHSPPLSLSLSLHPISLPLWQDRLLLSDKHSFSISAEKNQVAVSYTSLSLSLSLGCDTFSSSIPDTADILSPSFSQSLHLILSISLFLSPVSHILP